MKYLRLNGLVSDIIISVYVIITLFLRFKLEKENPTGVVESIVIGLCFVTILWVLIKLKILNPNWFGLFNTKKTKP